ncbi:MAG: spoIIE [Firmicutes bacterium]|nr:spoIIE [Bacillota bacterium]
MPKVSVITLPEEIIQAPPARPQARPVKENKPSWSWRIFGAWVKKRIREVFSWQNLQLPVLAILLGRVSILGEIAPFGLALFAAVAGLARPRAAGVGIGALVGVVSAGFYQEAILYLLSMLLYWRLSYKLSRYEKKAQAIPLFMFGTMFLCGAVIMPWRDFSLYGMLLVFFDAALCMVLSFIFRYGVPAFLAKPKEREIGVETLLSATIVLAIAVAGLGNLTLYGYSLRNIAGSIITMTLAFSGGSGVGAAVGVVTGLVIGLSSGDPAAAVVITMYALAGMIGGLFRELGKPAVLLGFMLGSATAVLYLGQPSQLVLVLVEVSVAGAAFMLVSAAKMRQWRETCFVEADDTQVSLRSVQVAAEKLTNISAILTDLANNPGTDNGKEAANYTEGIKEKQLAHMLAAVGEKICGPCARREECWDRDFYQTYQAMLDMLALAEAGKLKAGAVPSIINGLCINRQGLLALINHAAESNVAYWRWHRKITECRQMSREQLQATGVIINNLAQELRKGPQTDEEVAELLAERAAILGCPLTKVQVVGAQGKVRVEIQKKPCNGTRQCVNTILPVTANLLQEKMVLQADCGNVIGHRCCQLTMELDERYTVETGMATASKMTNKVSGDSVAVQPVSRGRIALILSDGMGSGQTAASSSRQAISFLQRLLSAGFDVDTAIKMVNSMLLINMPGDNFATIDMAVVDTFTGETEFLKVGSAPSYIKRVREVAVINPVAPPVGILDQVEIEPVTRVLALGDVMVMVSDGVSDAGLDTGKDNWVVNFLRCSGSERPQDIADRLLKQAIQFSGGIAKDDMVVLVAKIAERPTRSQ